MGFVVIFVVFGCVILFVTTTSYGRESNDNYNDEIMAGFILETDMVISLGRAWAKHDSPDKQTDHPSTLA